MTTEKNVFEEIRKKRIAYAVWTGRFARRLACFVIAPQLWAECFARDSIVHGSSAARLSNVGDGIARLFQSGLQLHAITKSNFAAVAMRENISLQQIVDGSFVVDWSRICNALAVSRMKYIRMYIGQAAATATRLSSTLLQRNYYIISCFCIPVR